MCWIQRKKKKKSQFGPPVLCRTFSFDPPLLFLLPPTDTPPPPTHAHTQTHRVQQICRISHQLLHRDERFFIHIEIYIYILQCVYMSTLLQQADTEGGEREIRRESDSQGEREE